MKLVLLLCVFALNSLDSHETPLTEILNEYSVTPSEGLLEVKAGHTVWDMMLKKYVSSTGKVDYEGFKSDPNFKRYIGILESANPADASWSANDKKAFWINAYNSFTIKLIIDNYPLKSIKDVGSPWDKKFITINGKNYSLNQIENDILRPTYNDPRIHFAVNCAAVSCPKLHNGAFTAENLNSKLEKLTKEFVNNKSMNDISAGQVKISKIFEWYAVDFTKSGSIIDWLNKYSTVKIDSGASVSYKGYTWSLNKK